MAFIVGEPADTTKIRNLGVVIRPNWASIEEADATFRPFAINLQNRTPLGVSNNPAVIAGTSIMYVKNDSVAIPEMFIKDSTNKMFQLTNGGRLGGFDTNLTMLNYRFGITTVDYSRNNIVSAMVSWDDTGAQVAAFGCTLAKTGTGKYTVTLTTPRATMNYWPLTGVKGDTTKRRMVKSQIISTSEFTITMVNNDGTLTDHGGFCHVVGGF